MLLQAEENKDEHMDEMLKKIKEHEAYVSKVDFTGSRAFVSVLLHLKRSNNIPEWRISSK